MKSSKYSPAALLSVILLSWLLTSQILMAQVTFDITPPAVPPQYTGMITLRITGLTNGEAVTIGKFADANKNGIIDAPDQQLQAFRLKDGQVKVIAGITNFNIPIDLDPAPGAITVQFNLASEGFEQHIVAPYLFKLASPSGRFAPVITPFSITNSSDLQTISGTISSGGNPVPYAWVNLFPGQGGKSYPVAGACADASGNYSVNVPVGTYSVFAAQNGFVADMKTMPSVTLTAGGHISANVNLLPATQTISGTVVDSAGNTNNPLAALCLVINSTNNLLALGLTDQNGNFSVGVTPSGWQIGLDGRDNVSMLGYMGINNGFQLDTTGGSVTGLSLSLRKATALIYGTLKDSQNHPIPGVIIYGDDQDNNEGNGVTDQNGNYVAAVVAGQWHVSTDNNDPRLANLLVSQSDSVVVNDGQAVRQDLMVLQATHLVTGYLKDANNNPISGIGIWANATINGVFFNSGNAITDDNGFYSINVSDGLWTVGVSSDSENGLNSSYLVPNNQTVSINNNDAIVNFKTLATPYTISGSLRNNLNQPLSGISVYGYTTINGASVNTGTQTDSNGSYSLGVTVGNWSVGISCNGGNNTLSPLGYQCVNEQTVSITNTSAVVNFTVQPCPPLQVATSSLADARVGSDYYIHLEAQGCNSPFTWSLAPGSGPLPNNLFLSPDGSISGNPTASGTFSISVRVTDGNGQTSDANLSINVAPGNPVQIGTSSLPNATQGSAYSQQLQASGGTAPYKWLLALGSANLPPGLVLSTNGVISGNPQSSGTYFFNVEVVDAINGTAQQGLSLNIAPTPLQIGVTVLPDATVGVSYTGHLSASGGMLPYHWSLALGSANLPDHLTLGSDGVIQGSPTTTGTYYFIAEVTDANMATVQKTIRLNIGTSFSNPRLGPPVRLSDKQMQIQISGATGQKYQIEMSTNLDFGWLPLSVTNAPANTFMIVDPAATNNQRYYRLLLVP